MRPAIAIFAIVGALLAGAAFGAVGSRLAVTHLAADPQARAGWTSGSPDAGLPKILMRALQALRDPAAFPDDTIRTFAAATDADGRALSGRSSYVLRFAAGRQPPVDAFWGLSALAADGRLSPSDAPSSLTSRAADLRRNPDGSLDVLVQASPPDDPAANWLPTPTDAFELILRLYAPKADATDGWRPPPLQRRETSA